MSNKTFSGLIWRSPAGVLAQAVETAARRDELNRSHQIEVGAARADRTKFKGKSYRRPMPTAAAALAILGVVLGTSMVITMIS